jgi:hypothetical protein
MCIWPYWLFRAMFTLNINICITIVIIGSANVSEILFTDINIYLKLDFQRHMSMIWDQRWLFALCIDYVLHKSLYLYKFIYINVYLTILTVSGYVFKLWKESVNSDGQQFRQYQQNELIVLNSSGQQFHQYQQNKQLPLTSTHWTPLVYDNCKTRAFYDIFYNIFIGYKIYN